MGADDSELQQLLLRYTNSEGEGRERMREVLQTTSAEVRYRTLIDMRGDYQDAAVHRGAWIGDLDSLKCMMSGFTSDQSYNVVKMQTNHPGKPTTLHMAAAQGHTDITKFLLSKLSQDQRFNILKIQDFAESTPLHRAARYKGTTDLPAMLTSVSTNQRKKLLNMKDITRKTIADITPLPELLYDVAGWTKIELDVTNQKLAEVETQCSEQKATIDQLVADLAEQREDNARQAEELRSLVDRQERMENMMEEMERLLRPEMDQEHEG